MTTPRLTLDHDVAAALVKDLRLLPPLDQFFFEPPASATEHLFHEVAHALSLGIRISRYFEVTTGERLRAVASLQAARRNEAVVLASEWILYSYTERPIDADDLRAAARSQYVPDPWLERARESQRALVLADQVGRWAIEHGVLVDNAASDKMFEDLQRRIRETLRHQRSKR